MNKIRLIGRLDIKGPNLIKGIRFEGLKVLGSPEEFALNYYNQGIDELIYIDTVASLYGRNNLLEFVKKIGEKVFIPITVAGGIRSVDDVNKFLNAGADKITINTGAVNNPKILKEITMRFGSQCVSLQVDAKKNSEKKWEVYTLQGREKTGLDVVEWIKKSIDLGVGEIFLTSIDQDGTRKGFDLDLITEVNKVINVPLIVSGGAGNLNHIKEVLDISKKINLAIGSIIHNKILTIKEIKTYIKKQGSLVRSGDFSE
jgi:cyclase